MAYCFAWDQNNRGVWGCKATTIECNGSRRLQSIGRENKCRVMDMGEWIFADDQLPTEEENVLVYGEWYNVNPVMKWAGKGLAIGYYKGGKWRISGKCDVIVTHWMALPNIPKEV